MSPIDLQKAFTGQARLVRLLLWKIGDSTDVGDCLDVALSKGMIDADDASFLSECMREEESSRDGSAPSIDLDDSVVVRLRRCADKLNRADSA